MAHRWEFVNWDDVLEKGRQARAKEVFCQVDGQELIGIASHGAYLEKELARLIQSRDRMSRDISHLYALAAAGRAGHTNELNVAREATRSATRGMERMRTRLRRAESRLARAEADALSFKEQAAALQAACHQYQKEAVALKRKKTGGA